MTVFIVYNEYGEYSDYVMGIDGVFSTVEKAKEAIEGYDREAAAAHPSNRWEWNDWAVDDSGVWHREDKRSYGRTDVTIAPYVIDEELHYERR